MSSPHTKPSRTSIVAFAMILLPVLYVVSYAPFVRVCAGTYTERRTHRISVLDPSDVILPGDGSRYPAYKPVDWLIDNTPIRGPMFWWADIWGVRDELERGADAREFLRESEFWSSDQQG